MRLSPVILAAVGDSQWQTPGTFLVGLGVSLALLFSEDANLTCTVQYSYDETTQNPVAVSLARAATVLTVTFPEGHMLNTGDNINLENEPTGTWNGGYDVASAPSDTTVTVTVPNAGATNSTAEAQVFRVFNHATLSGITGAPPARIDGQLGYPVSAVRLKVTAWTAGSVELDTVRNKGA